ncbi:hypothetical protein V1477_017043 [Vespula maculifrons]|uniref:Uncharacterized protein n=1 Tax=Vespula maculifrons TaxID=7453 RepID=A0ABD2B4V8_VESMC
MDQLFSLSNRCQWGWRHGRVNMVMRMHTIVAATAAIIGAAASAAHSKNSRAEDGDVRVAVSV